MRKVKRKEQINCKEEEEGRKNKEKAKSKQATGCQRRRKKKKEKKEKEMSFGRVQFDLTRQHIKMGPTNVTKFIKIP